MWKLFKKQTNTSVLNVGTVLETNKYKCVKCGTVLETNKYKCIEC